MKDEKIFLGQIEDRIRRCEERYVTTSSAFLDEHQQSMALGLVREAKRNGINAFFYGGYEDAERRILLCLADYDELAQADPLLVIRVQAGEGGKKLTHRDYLGALVGLGIKREKIGDILVREDGADIIVMEDISEFILLNYTSVGRHNVGTKGVPMRELILPKKSHREVKDTVASLRLDNIISSAFGLSRSKACEAIKRGLVFVNHQEILKIDYQVKEGDRIVLRHKGKVNLIEIGGTSRKGRLYVTYEVY